MAASHLMSCGWFHEQHLAPWLPRLCVVALNALKRGVEVVTGYGMSETCPVVTIAHLNEADAQAMERLEREILAGLGIDDPYL